MTPLVSVIIPTFKRSDFLVRAINSVLSQSYGNVEIIVVDDNNEDEFRDKLKEVLRPMVESNLLRYVKHEVNKGLPAARNSGIRESKGQFIAFLDDDDVWLAEKLEKQMDLFQRLPAEYGLVYCGWKIREEGKSDVVMTPRLRGDVREHLGLNHISPPSMVVVKKHYLDLVGGFDESFFWRQDIELYFRLAKVCLFDFVTEPLVDYYKHPEAMSRNYLRKQDALELFLKKHHEDLSQNKLVLSEVYERLGELQALNGNQWTALKIFLKSYIRRPRRFQIVGKAALALLGKKLYKRVRRF